jgi:hypothetical protein
MAAKHPFPDFSMKVRCLPLEMMEPTARAKMQGKLPASTPVPQEFEIAYLIDST